MPVVAVCWLLASLPGTSVKLILKMKNSNRRLLEIREVRRNGRSWYFSLNSFLWQLFRHLSRFSACQLLHYLANNPITLQKCDANYLSLALKLQLKMESVLMLSRPSPIPISFCIKIPCFNWCCIWATLTETTTSRIHFLKLPILPCSFVTSRSCNLHSWNISQILIVTELKCALMA